MAFQCTEGVIIGIAVGGGCLLFGIVATIVMLIVRSKHRRLISRIDANTRRRSRRLSGIFNITDYDVARMPGMRVSPRGSSQNPDERSPCTPMSSRDTFDSRQTLTKDAKISRSQDNAENDRFNPVPTRSRRSSKKAKSKKRSQPVGLSPITERHRSGGTSSPIMKDTLEKADSLPKADPLSEPTLQRRHDLAANVIETPKPLFHSQRKLSYSITPNTFPRRNGTGNSVSGLYTMDVMDPTPRPLEGSRPRSKSLYNRESGLFPDHVPPPIPSHAPQISLLPWERAKGALDRAKSQKSSKEKRISEASIMSESTSILDHEKPRGFSQVLSIGIPSPAIVDTSNNNQGPFDNRRTLWDSSSVQDRNSSQQANQIGSAPPEMVTHKSLQADVQASQAKSTSSGLSFNMSLDPSHKSGSTIDPSKLAMISNVQSVPPKLQSADRKRFRRDSSRSASLSRSNTFEVHDDSKHKRLSSPVLQPTSGNQRSPTVSPETTVRSSMATDISYDWDLDNPIPIAKSRLSLHKRQNFTQTPVLIGKTELGSQPSKLEEREKNALTNNAPVTITEKEPTTTSYFRPPSTLLFDPQFAYTPDSHSPRAIPRFESRSSPEQEMYTPIRKPSDRPRHHHRYKSIIGHPGMTKWPKINSVDSSVDQNTAISDPLRSNIFRQSLQPEDSDLDSRPSTVSIPSFPTPPPKSPVRRLHQPNWRGPKTPIRHPMGPRPMLPSTSRIPVRQQSPLGGYSRRSPTRSAGITKPRRHSPSKSNSNSPSKMLNNISLLRRMNSEANAEVTVRGSREHKRYQSIGDLFEEEAFSDGDVLDGGKENVRESARGPSAMPETGYLQKVSTESSRYNLFAGGKVVGSYDDKGFLKEGSTSGFDF